MAVHRATARRLPAAARQHPLEPEPAPGAQRRRHVPVRQAAQHPQRPIGQRRGLVAQHPAQGLDLGRRPLRQVGQRALADLVAVAEALAQQDGRRRVAVRDAFDVHGQLESRRPTDVKRRKTAYMGTKIHRNPGFRFPANGLRGKLRVTSA